MGLFLSKFENKVDKKGRVSVPARYRATLEKDGYDSFVVFPSIDGTAIQACTLDVMESLVARLGPFDPFSSDQDTDAHVLMSEAEELRIDGDGRVGLPAHMMEDCGISEKCMFVGRGDNFQICAPEVYQARKSEARQAAREKREARRHEGEQ